MKRNILSLVLLLALTSFVGISYGQETRITGTLNMHPWVKLPVVISTDIQGGMQSVGPITLSASPAVELNTAIPSYTRNVGMVASVIDAGKNNQIRYFEYTGTDKWLEVSVVHQWETGHIYSAGESVSFNGNFYVANTGFTSADAFPKDSALWNSWGGKDAKFDVKKLMLNGDTLTGVAVKDDVVPDIVKKHTLATVSYIDNASSTSTFDGSKAITRPGWTGITGFNPATDNVVDFLNKVFYPVSTPLITSFNYNGGTTSGKYSFQSADAQKIVTDQVGTITIPYSAWNTATGLTFNYAVTNQSIADESTDTPISKVDLFLGSTNIGSNPVNSSAASITGTFNPVKSSFTTNIDNDQNSVMRLQVTDNASNVVNLNLNIKFTKAQGVSVSSAVISATSGGISLLGEGSGSVADPYLIERTGSDLTRYTVWGLTFNDDKKADLAFEGTYKPANIAASTTITGNAAFTIPNTATTSAFRVGTSATGDVAHDVSAIVYSSYYLLQDNLYCGFLPSDVEPTESQLKGLPNSSLKTTNYYQTGGVTYPNSSGSSGFFAWAIPTYILGTAPAPSFSKTVYYEAAGTWNINTNTNTYTVNVTPPAGGAQSWYWVCIYKASTGNGGSIKVKLSN